MGKYRIPGKNSKYYMPKEDYLTAVHWCLRYPRWKGELELDVRRAITYDQDRVQTSNNSDPTSAAAIRNSEVLDKMRLLENTIKEVDEFLYEYLLLAVAYGFTEHQLRDKGLPCGRNQFYESRQHVFYLISKRI